MTKRTRKNFSGDFKAKVALEALGVQIGPIVLCSLLWITVRRTTAASMMGVTATDGNAEPRD